MIGEFLSSENLILHSEDHIVMHSIVDNATGVIICDPEASIAELGFACVPHKSCGVFILEEAALKLKISKVRESVGCLSMAATEEGVVLQLIDRVENKVVGLIKAKSVEY